MNNTGYREEALPLWQKALNLLRPLFGLSCVAPTLVAEEIETIFTDWQPPQPKCLPAPPEIPLLPASIGKE
jgi:hypothetical protein